MKQQLPVEVGLKMKCDSCKNEYPLDKDGDIRFVRIQRGWFRFQIEDGELGGIDEDETNIKCELWVCEKCYLEDPDLCRFFNKIGYRIR